MEDIAAGRVKNTAAERRRREINGGALAIGLLVLEKMRKIKRFTGLGVFMRRELMFY